MIKAYSITAESVASERARVGGDLDKVDIARVVGLDTLELPEMGPTDVHPVSYTHLRAHET